MVDIRKIGKLGTALRPEKPNSLAIAAPEIAAEWHQTKNGALTPSDVSLHSGKAVWWICKKGHDYQARIADRTGKYACGCPYCSNKRVLQGFNDLATTDPDLANEWHPNRNGNLQPSDVTRGSSKKVWWICDEKHDFQASPNSRTSNGSGCPYCSSRMLLKGYNDLSTFAPGIAAEWHPTKNGSLTPSDVSKGAFKKVWWLCPCGHEYEAYISRRTGPSHTGCPYCANQKLLPGYNDLAIVAPAIAAEWHPTKNGDLKPADVLSGSSTSVWWECPLGHDYKMHVNQRTGPSHSKCPICSGRQVLSGFNSLAAVAPTIAAEWHPTKNGGLKPTDVSRGSDLKVWWICSNGHEYESSIKMRTKSAGCPYCANKRVLPGYNDLATVAPKIAAEWHPMKNGDLKPKDITVGSDTQVWWKCPHGHDYKMKVCLRTGSSHYNCPVCSGQQVLSGFNDLETVAPQIASEWHPTKNGDLKPTDVTRGTKIKVWWICSNGHEYPAKIANRTVNHTGCPYCAGKKAMPGFNDLAILAPEIAAEWHPTKNGSLRPSDLTSGSQKKVWWRCSIGHDYQATINSRVNNHTGCPYCSGNKVALENSLAQKYPELMKEWDFVNNYAICDPNEISEKSILLVWWNCQNDSSHKYPMQVCDRVTYLHRSKTACPYCKGRRRKKNHYV